MIIQNNSERHRRSEFLSLRRKRQIQIEEVGTVPIILNCTTRSEIPYSTVLKPLSCILSCGSGKIGGSESCETAPGKYTDIDQIRVA